MSEAARFLDRHTAEIEPLHLDYNHKYWVASLTGTPQDAAASAAAKEARFRVYARPDEYDRVRELAGGPVSDPLEARQLVLLRNEYAARQMDPAVLADLV